MWSLKANVRKQGFIKISFYWQSKEKQEPFFKVIWSLFLFCKVFQDVGTRAQSTKTNFIKFTIILLVCPHFHLMKWKVYGINDSFLISITDLNNKKNNKKISDLNKLCLTDIFNSVIYIFILNVLEALPLKSD